MKNLILNYIVFGCLLLASFWIKKEDNFLELMNTNDVEVTIRGNGESTHYLEPIIIEIKNDSRKIIETVLPAGLHFETEDPSYQDVISTQQQLVKVAPNSTKTFRVSGVCIQSLNSSPDDETVFSLNGMGEAPLVELAKYLDKKDIQGSNGQHAMWVLSDGASLYDIIGLEDEGEKELIAETARIGKLSPIKKEEFEERKEQVVNPTYSSSLRGYFKFEFSRKTKVHIAIFNQDDVLIKEVYNKEVEPGFHKIDYALETTELEGQKITSQLIAYNKVISRRTIDLRQR